jgi:hypothetical protein
MVRHRSEIRRYLGVREVEIGTGKREVPKVVDPKCEVNDLARVKG